MRASDRKQAHDELLSVIRGVRRRWRMRRLLGGLAATGAVALLIGLGAVALLDRLGDASAAAPWVRAAAGAIVAIAAAWLIERSGFARGHGNGRASLSTKHTLALTNRGGATTADLLALAREVRGGVEQRFGVVLENEPVTVGCAL